jgi:hypothetical protein
VIILKYMGTVDRVVSAVIVVVFANVYYPQSISGLAGIIQGILTIIIFLLNITAVCPLYGPLDNSTMKEEK